MATIAVQLFTVAQQRFFDLHLKKLQMVEAFRFLANFFKLLQFHQLHANLRVLVVKGTDFFRENAQRLANFHVRARDPVGRHPCFGQRQIDRLKAGQCPFRFLAFIQLQVKINQLLRAGMHVKSFHIHLLRLDIYLLQSLFQMGGRNLVDAHLV
ncbi:hypothetical protein [Brevibacillus agri]|uniref:hypothetical protein n=1 Tax=Brevibacillus agri TaxID=51101 RepID=UPI003B75BA7D